MPVCKVNHKMDVSIIGTAGIPACYGGYETLAENLVKNKNNDIEYTVFCSAKLYKERVENYMGAKLRYVNLNANGLSSILYDLVCMLLSLRSDVMLILGYSAAFFFPLVRLVYRGRIITNIDGIECKRNKFNVIMKIIIHFNEKLAIKYSDVIIADNQGVVDYVGEIYKKKAVLIEYGADHVI